MISSECQNCNTPLQSGFSFCPSCGQKSNLHRFSLHDISHEAIHYFTHADKGFLQLIKALFLKTGTVGREYVEGKRKKYFPALNFYLVVAAIYVLLINLYSGHVADSPSAQQPEITSISDPVKRERVRKIYARRDEAVAFMNKYSNFVAMTAIPVIALIYWLCYRKGRYNYTEHLVSGMYMVGFTNMLYVILIVPIFILLGWKSSRYSLLILFLYQVTYYSVYYYHFMNTKTRASLFKSIGVSALVVIFWTAVTSLLVAIYISNGFWGFIQ